MSQFNIGDCVWFEKTIEPPILSLDGELTATMRWPGFIVRRDEGDTMSSAGPRSIIMYSVMILGTGQVMTENSNLRCDRLMADFKIGDVKCTWNGVDSKLEHQDTCFSQLPEYSQKLIRDYHTAQLEYLARVHKQTSELHEVVTTGSNRTELQLERVITLGEL